MTGYELLQRLSHCDLDKEVNVCFNGKDLSAVSLCWETLNGESVITIYADKKEADK